MKIIRPSLLIAFLVFFALGLAQAQIQDDLWFEGVVYLEGGDAVEGKISYYSDHKTGLLQVNVGDKILSYDANQIVSFSFYDDKLGINRRFYSLPFKRPGENYDIMLFFEASVEGSHLSLLSKTVWKAETRTTNPYSYRYGGYYIPTWYNDPYMPRSYSVMVPYETLYLVSPESEIEPYAEPTAINSRRIRYRKSDFDLLLDMVKDKRGAVETYVKENKLDYREKPDLARIIGYYNHLKQQEVGQ